MLDSIAIIAALIVAECSERSCAERITSSASERERTKDDEEKANVNWICSPDATVLFGH